MYGGGWRDICLCSGELVLESVWCVRERGSDDNAAIILLFGTHTMNMILPTNLFTSPPLSPINIINLTA